MTNEQKFTTASGRIKAFERYCDASECSSCIMHGKTRKEIGRMGCIVHWLTLEAKADEIEPCPFCGGECCISEGFPHDHVVSCQKCDYISSGGDTDAESIAAHNRVCRAVRAAEKGEAK